jgi:RND family efflux transporter MFP subunit
VLSTEATATVLAPRDGILIELRASEGAQVTKGQELARLSTEELDGQLEQAQLEANRLSIEERQYEAMVQANQSERDQEAALLKDGLISKRQYDRVQYELDASIQELEKARLATQTARSRIQTVKLDMAKCTIRAPIAGIVTQRQAKLGTSIIRNEKLFEVAQVWPLEVKFHLPLSDPARIGPGRVLDLSLVGDDRLAARARVRRLDPVAEISSNTRGYCADVLGGAGLIPGMAVTVHLPPETAAKTLSVPRAAFPAAANLGPGAPNALFTLEGDRAKARSVSLGALDGNEVEISSGLAAGDRVILAPPAGLANGDRVRVVSETGIPTH